MHKSCISLFSKRFSTFVSKANSCYEPFFTPRVSITNPLYLVSTSVFTKFNRLEHLISLKLVDAISVEN